MLYDGPWIAERLAGTAELVAQRPDAIHPAVRTLLERGHAVSGVEVFEAQDRLRRLQRDAADVLRSVDALLTPTVATTFSVEDMLADPIARNARLGRYTTFGNLLDLAAIALPTATGRPDRPFGVSVAVGAGEDSRMHGIAATLEQVFSTSPDRAPAPVENAPHGGASQTLPIAVVGAHLRGMPLHHELLALGARLRTETATTPEYRLYALDTVPPKPGLVRVGAGGSTIRAEVYDVPIANIGAFLRSIPSPLGLGMVRLAGGAEVHGFLCESVAVEGARDVSEYGGWRAYAADASPPGSDALQSGNAR
jgi:allophanate hydrolase